MPEPVVSSAGQEAIDLARSAGLDLDPWQEICLNVSLAEDVTGNWLSFEILLELSRQNGKGAVLEARELAGLVLFNEQMILHSAHEFKTAQEGFLRIEGLFTNYDELRRRVKRITRAHGEEGIELLTGQRLRFIARSRGSGRGFTGDCVILDEAMILSPLAIAAVMPTLSAVPNPQLWYVGSAGDDNSAILGSVRRRAVAAMKDGGEDSLSVLSWAGCDPDEFWDLPEDEQLRIVADPQVWWRTNPGIGYRISQDHIGREHRAMDLETFARERLSIGRYPPKDANENVIDPATWTALENESSRIQGERAFAIDMDPARTATSIAACGFNAEEKEHVELVARAPGSAWVVERMIALDEKWQPVAIGIDPSSAAGDLIEKLELAGLEVTPISGRDYAYACGAFYDATGEGGDEPTLAHINQPLLNAAATTATWRNLGDGKAWDRKSNDIAPLCAATIARHVFLANAESGYDVGDSIL